MLKEPISKLVDREAYLKVPLHRERLRFETIGLEESIREFIWLIMTTRTGSYRFDPEFGCHIWDQEFQYLKRGRFKEDIQKAIQEAVEKYETRMKNVRVDITVSGFEEEASSKRVVEIFVKGIIKSSGRNFEGNFEIDWDRGRKHSSP